MANWKYTLDIRNIWVSDKMSVEKKGKAIAVKIRQTFPKEWFDWESDEYDEDLEDLIERFENITGYDEITPVEEFDNCMDELYDFGDQHVTPWRWPSNKMAWIATSF